MKKSMIGVVTVTILLLAGAVHATVPPLMNYQGKLTDEYGVPVPDGNYSIQFRIYTDSIGGDSLWEELQWSVQVTDGLFNVLLGSVEDIPDTVFSGTVRWLGVQVSPDPELIPRKPIVSVAYAFRSTKADTADYVFSTTDGDWTIADSILYPSGNYGLSMRESNVLHGEEANTHVNFGAGCVTGAPGTNRQYCTVAGGRANTASANYATVGGGRSNTASDDSATVSGGSSNTANGSVAVVGGGIGNQASGNYSTVSGGKDNEASAHGAAVSGGVGNTANAWCAVVGCGAENTATNQYATIAGGHSNDASGQYAFIGGGLSHTASAGAATVGGGTQNTASAGDATVAGGRENIASGYRSTVGGGRNNEANGDYAIVGGGEDNIVNGEKAIIGGGIHNRAGGQFAAIGGGQYNTANGEYATVSGGENNTATRYASVSGGLYNSASDWYATVGGGTYNTASAEHATVCGGDSNTASGHFATVGGGYADTVAGAYSFAAGRLVRVTAGAHHTFAFGRDFTTSTPNAVIFHNSVDPVRMGVGTPNPDTTLHIVGNIKMVDGNEAAGKVLTSDADGVGNWQSLPGPGNVPVGSILAWLKSFPGTPSLPTEYVECNGQVLSDLESPYDGQTIPNLNGDNRFLRGSSSSGEIGGSSTHTHTYANMINGGELATRIGHDAIEHYSQSTGVDNCLDDHTEPASTLPPYYHVVWIMRVK